MVEGAANLTVLAARGEPNLVQRHARRIDSDHLAERDLAEASDEGKRLAIIIEQRGCIYCTKMHEEVFPDPDITRLLTDDFFVVQINMFGDVEVTDFDGETLSEKEIVKNYERNQLPGATQIRASVSSASNSLFEAIDSSHDQRISLREMKNAAENLSGVLVIF